MLTNYKVSFLHNDQKEQEKAKLGHGVSFEYSVQAEDEAEARKKGSLLFQSENTDLDINDYSSVSSWPHDPD